MSDLTPIEKRKLEQALCMEQGYVLRFSNRTFEELFMDVVGIEISEEKYNWGSGSKANRMRAFWKLESNSTVGRVLDYLFKNWSEFKYPDAPEVPDDCLRVVARLMESLSVPNIDAVKPNADDPSFAAVARAARDSIEKNEPEAGLDRLHTYLIWYFREHCRKRGIDTNDKPLHSLVGEFVKALKREGRLESEMAERILRSSISIMDSFNQIRNEKSFAHANKVLNYTESILVFAHVSATIQFIESIDGAANRGPSIEPKDLD